MTQSAGRRLSTGVEIMRDGSVDARVWAPARHTVDLAVIQGAGTATHIHPLKAEGEGFFRATLTGLSAGDRYWFRLDGDLLRPDPVSRFQPEGPHGPSEIVNPEAFTWTDAAWPGIGARNQVLYEMHVGTFTQEGTWAAAARELAALADLGVTTIEMMPIGDFAGVFGWGYDGVDLYAPTRLYGRPDDLRRFIDRAHAVGLAVILDVVYNHLGPDGNYLGDYSKDYFTDRYKNDWGQALNFEGLQPAREIFVGNAPYWIDEYHFDGLRLDATQDIHDDSPEHAIAEVARRARAAARGRSIYLIAENESQDTGLVRPAAAHGCGLDAVWNDDYHHSARVALTGRREAYYTDYTGAPQEFVSCAKYGYLYQGQWYAWQKKRRGSPGLDLEPQAFVSYLENHDQVANSVLGRRMHQLASPGRFRALVALTLLGPATPLLFQGEEFASSAPFLFFADHEPALHDPIRKGRVEFLTQFPSVTDPDIPAHLASPVDEATFRRCKLDLSERTTHALTYALYRDLLHLRRSDPALVHGRERRVDGAVLSGAAFVLRFFGGGHGDRLLVVNLGPDLDPSPVPEPLLAAPRGARWRVRWSSESVAYGGQGTPPIHASAAWHVPGEAAVLLEPEPDGGDDNDDDEQH